MSAKKILLIGFILVLLVAIPVTVFLVQQQTKTKTGAQRATTLSLTPATKTVTAGQKVTLTLNVNPGINQISFVKFTITYDPTKLKYVDGSFKRLDIKESDGTTTQLSIRQGPDTTTPGVISATLAIGSVQYVIQNPADIASLDFDTTDLTGTTTVNIVQDDKTKTQVLSLGTSDQFNENVLLSTVPATITASGNPVPTDTDTPTPTEEVTTVPTDTPTPTPTGEVVTTTPTDTPTPTPTGTQTSTGPSCSSLSLNPANNGVAPFTVNLTAIGQDNSSTISKVTFNFGDGTTQDITDSSGIGTNSVSVLQSHVYNNAGSYTATATLTDASGSVSNVGSCSVTISVASQIANQTTTSTAVTETPVPLAPTGPRDIVTLGSIGAVITVIGAVLLLAL